MSVRCLCRAVAVALFVLGSGSTCFGQAYVAGYVDEPTNYVTDQAARAAFERVLSGKVQWKAFPTEEALASAMSEGEVQVGIGQTVGGWLNAINSGQSTTAVAVSRVEEVPCLITTEALDRLKTGGKGRYRLQIPGAWAEANVGRQIKIAGIDGTSLDYVFSDFDPSFVDADISCVPGQIRNNSYVPLLTGAQEDALLAESTALITVAPGFEIDARAKEFLFADDAAKAVAKSTWTADKSAGIVLPSIYDQNAALPTASVLGLLKAWSKPEDLLIAEAHVSSGPLMDLGSGVQGVKLLFGTDRVVPDSGGAPLGSGLIRAHLDSD